MQPRNRAARPRKQWVTLTDAFRQLVCAAYPRRPQLADEIQSYRWFTHPSERLEIFHCPYCAPQEELQAAKAALDALKRGVRQEEIRLRGCLSNRLSKPRKDIDSTEARDGELNIFDRVLEVSEGGGVVRKYQQVDCLANDIRRIARTFNTTVTGASKAAFTETSAADFVAKQFQTMPNTTLDAVRAAARGRGNRTLLDGAYKDYLQKLTGKSIRPGPRPKRALDNSAKSNSAEK
jgi:hypothetical protein